MKNDGIANARANQTSANLQNPGVSRSLPQTASSNSLLGWRVPCDPWRASSTQMGREPLPAPS
jgi:hypothetical protein